MIKMVTEHTIQRIGWLYDADDGVDPITNGGVPYYHFGRQVAPFGKYPSTEYQPRAMYDGGNRDVSNFQGRQNPRGNLSFAPINGIPFYKIMGASTTTAGVHKITGVDSGSLETFTTRYQTENASYNYRRSMIGCKANSLLYRIDRKPMTFVSGGLSFQGRRTIAPAHDADYAPVYPDSISTPYLPSPSMVFKWDVTLSSGVYASGGDDYKDALLGFQTVIDTTNRQVTPEGQQYPEWILEGDRTYVVQMQMIADLVSILDDFEDQANGNYRDLHCKVFHHGSSGYYTQLDFEEVFMKLCEPNHSPPELGDSVPVYNVTAIAKNLVVSSKDGLTSNSTFYGE